MAMISEPLPFGRLWLWRAERDRECNQLRDAPQPVT